MNLAKRPIDPIWSVGSLAKFITPRTTANGQRTFEAYRAPGTGAVAEPSRHGNRHEFGPRKDHLACATDTDHLVIDEIRCEPDQCQIATTLSNSLVSGSEGNKMAEAFRGHRITIVYERADGLFEAANSRHTREAEQTRFHSAETASEASEGLAHTSS
jgi:hypothetical protein